MLRYFPQLLAAAWLVMGRRHARDVRNSTGDMQFAEASQGTDKKPATGAEA